MRKSKVLKALLVFGMSIATATSVVGMTACNGEHEHTYGDWKSDKDGHWKVATCHTDVTTEKETHKDDNKDNKCDVCGYTLATGGEEHKHTYGDWKADGDKGHYKEATCHPGEKTATEQHKDANKDGKCDDCKYEMQTETPDPKPPVVYDNVSIDIGAKFPNKDITITAGTELVEGSGVSLTEDLKTASSSGKKFLYAGTEINSVTRINVNGAISATEKDNALVISKGIKVEAKAAAKVLIYAHSTSGGVERSVKMLNSEGVAVGDTQSIGNPDGNFVGVAIFDVTAAGTYYFGSADGSIGVFYIAVVYKDFEETKTEVPAVAADCVNTGNPKYYSTNYGRYYKEDGTTLVTAKSQITLEALKHDYSGQDYTLEATDYPTAENPGKATVSCGRVDISCNHIEEIILPVLSSRSYARTSDNASEGNYIYTYEDIVTGKTITFENTAVEPEAVKSSYTVDLDSKIDSIDGYVTSAWAVSASNYKAVAATIDGKTFASGVKLNSSGYLDIVLDHAATVTFHIGASQTLKYAPLVEGTPGTTTTSGAAVSYAGGGYTVTITFASAGAYRISRGGSTEMVLYRVVIVPAAEA